MRVRASIGAAVLLLAAPTALAFFSGGYYDEPRLYAAVGVWLLVLVAAFVSPARPLPASLAGRVAAGGLLALTVWTAASISWAPLAGPALDAAQRLALYLGALLAAIALLRGERVARLVEPAFGFGGAIVIGYGLSGRLLPGLIDLDRSDSAGARLEQPITYWNAEGLLAAVALVLCARMAGDGRRPPALRALAVAAAVPLGAGVYLAYSRGAIAAGVLGLIILLAAAPSRATARGLAITVAAAVVASVLVELVPGVADLRGSDAERERDGALVLAGLVVLALAAATAALLVARREQAARLATGPLPGARALPAVAAAAAVLALAGLVAGGLGERGNPDERQAPTAERLVSLQTSRYDYWRVGLRAFADEPVTGLGAGGFRVEWLRERDVLEGVLDIHSLELEALVELGVVGLAFLLAFLGGLAAATREALRRRPALAAGPLAAGSAWLAHASIDWDWQLPAVTLPFVIMAGALIAAGEAPRDAAPEPAGEGAATEPREPAAPLSAQPAG